MARARENRKAFFGTLANLHSATVPTKQSKMPRLALCALLCLGKVPGATPATTPAPPTGWGCDPHGGERGVCVNKLGHFKDGTCDGTCGANASTPVHTCTSDWDCSLAGTCDATSGRCACDAWASGSDCSYLRFQPLDKKAMGYVDKKVPPLPKTCAWTRRSRVILSDVGTASGAQHSQHSGMQEETASHVQHSVVLAALSLTPAPSYLLCPFLRSRVARAALVVGRQRGSRLRQEVSNGTTPLSFALARARSLSCARSLALAVSLARSPALSPSLPLSLSLSLALSLSLPLTVSLSPSPSLSVSWPRQQSCTANLHLL